MKGWVYIISNAAMPGLRHIGASEHDPEHTLESLEHPGVPHPYTLDYEALVLAPEAVIEEVAARQVEHHQGKSWYRTANEPLMRCIREVAGSGLLYEAPSERLLPPTRVSPVLDEPPTGHSTLAFMNPAAAPLAADSEPRLATVTPLKSVSPKAQSHGDEPNLALPSLSAADLPVDAPSQKPQKPEEMLPEHTSTLLKELSESEHPRQSVPEPYLATEAPIAHPRKAAPRPPKNEHEERLHERRRQHEAEEIQARYQKKMRKFNWPVGLLLSIFFVCTLVACLALIKLQGPSADSQFLSCYFSADFLQCYFGFSASELLTNTPYYLLKLRDAAAYALLPSLVIYLLWIAARRSSHGYKRLQNQREHELSMIGY